MCHSRVQFCRFIFAQLEFLSSVTNRHQSSIRAYHNMICISYSGIYTCCWIFRVVSGNSYSYESIGVLNSELTRYFWKLYLVAFYICTLSNVLTQYIIWLRLRLGKIWIWTTFCLYSIGRLNSARDGVFYDNALSWYHILYLDTDCVNSQVSWYISLPTIFLPDSLWKKAYISLKWMKGPWRHNAVGN